MSNIKCLSLLVSGFKRRMNKMGGSETRMPATATLSTLATIMLSGHNDESRSQDH